MKTNTIFKFNFTYELWTQALNAQQQLVLQFNRTDKGLLVPGAAQTYLFTLEALPVGSVLRNVRDPKGTAVFFESGFDMDRYITASEPTFDYQGNVDGYRQTVHRTAPYVYRGTEL